MYVRSINSRRTSLNCPTKQQQHHWLVRLNLFYTNKQNNIITSLQQRVQNRLGKNIEDDGKH